LKNDLLGSWSVLYFYPKDMTPGCTKEACSFRDASRKLKNRGMKVYGVSADSPERHQKFIAKEKLNFDLLSDENHKVMEKYGVWGEKSMYGKKFMGIQRMTFLLDPDGKIRHIWTKVDTARHADEVLEKYQELQEN
jgi:peroxiredoxin Q/BCP